MTEFQPHQVLSLDDAAKILNTTGAALRKRIHKGELSGIKIAKGQRQVWAMLRAEVDRLMMDTRVAVTRITLQDILGWKEMMLTGELTGRPLAPTTVKTHLKAVKYLEDKLGRGLQVDDLTAEQLLKVWGMYKPTHETCHYAVKFQIYNAARSLLLYLVRQGRGAKGVLKDLVEARPKRLLPPKKTRLTSQEQLDLLLDFNLNRHTLGRSLAERVRAQAILALATLAGLRTAEIINLKAKDYDSHTRLINVYGKGNKPRVVGVQKQLAEVLALWKRYRDDASPWLICSHSGEQYTESATRQLLIKLIRAAKKEGVRLMAEESDQLREKGEILANLKVTMHGLRRTFATLQSDKNMPLTMLSKALGHANLATTQGYIMTDEMQAAEYLKRI